TRVLDPRVRHVDVALPRRDPERVPAMLVRLGTDDHGTRPGAVRTVASDMQALHRLSRPGVCHASLHYRAGGEHQIRNLASLPSTRIKALGCRSDPLSLRLLERDVVRSSR